MTTQTIIELLARREGWQFIQCGENSSTPGMWRVKPPNATAMVVARFETKEGAVECFSPSYLSSLDALQPVLATLTTQEWVEVASHAMPPAEISTLPWANFRKGVMMKPELLATCIAKAIEKKGEE